MKVSEGVVASCELKLKKRETGVLGKAVGGLEVSGVEVAKLRELPTTVEGRGVKVGKLRELLMTMEERGVEVIELTTREGLGNF